MITFLSSNFLSLPELPSVSRSKDSRRFVRYYGGTERAGYRSNELKRGIGRWENEGGAIGPERNRHKFAIRTSAGEERQLPAQQMRTCL